MANRSYLEVRHSALTTRHCIAERRDVGAPLTGLPWRATSSVAGETPVPGRAASADGSRETGDGADARRMNG